MHVTAPQRQQLILNKFNFFGLILLHQRFVIRIYLRHSFFGLISVFYAAEIRHKKNVFNFFWFISVFLCARYLSLEFGPLTGQLAQQLSKSQPGVTTEKFIVEKYTLKFGPPTGQLAQQLSKSQPGVTTEKFIVEKNTLKLGPPTGQLARTAIKISTWSHQRKIYSRKKYLQIWASHRPARPTAIKISTWSHHRKIYSRKKYLTTWASHRPARQNSYQNLNLESPEKNL